VLVSITHDRPGTKLGIIPCPGRQLEAALLAPPHGETAAGDMSHRAPTADALSCPLPLLVLGCPELLQVA
jgi:hypothetical protein